MNADGLARRMLTVSGFLTLSRVAAAGLTFLFQALIARLLGADALGAYVLATSLAAVLAIALTLGFGAVTARFVTRYRADGRLDLVAGFRRAGFLHLGVLTLLVSGGGIAAILLIPGLVPDALRLPLAAGILAAPLLALIRLNGAWANIHRRFLLGFLPDILARPALQLALLGLAALFAAVKGPMVAIAVFLASTALAALAQALMVGRLLPAPAVAPASEARLWRSAGAPMAISVLLMTYLAEVDVLLLSALLDPASIAVFSVPVRLVAFVGFAIYAVYQVALPDLSEAWAEGRRGAVEAAIGRANRLCLAVAVAAFVGAALFGRWALAVFGPEFEAGYGPLLLVAAAQVVVAAAGPGAQLLTVAGEQQRCLAAYACGFGLVFLLNLLLVPALGAEGAALAFAAGMALPAVMLAFFARRRLALDPSAAALLRKGSRPAPNPLYNPLNGPVAQQDRASDS